MTRNSERTNICLILYGVLCLLFLHFTSVYATELELELESTDASILNYLPDCTTEEKKLNLFVISTLDGKISVVDAVEGNLKWSKQITSGPLLSSSISDFMVNNKGEIVRIVPSLDGNLFVHNGRTIKQTQFSTEKLLKNSLKFSENVLLVGGQENKIIGLNLQDGSVAYECGFKGCSQVENITYDNVILLKKTSQSVRAINSLSGKEEWHFVVNDPQLVNIGNEHCSSIEQDESPHYVDFKVIVPSGFIHSSVYVLDPFAVKQLHKEWNIKFDSPIVNMWHYEAGKLDQVNLFNRDTIDIKGILIDQNFKEPDFYIGSYNNQLYIQKSNFYKEYTNLLTREDNVFVDHLSEQNTAIIQVEWKDAPENKQNINDNFELSTKSAFPFLTFNKVNSTGYYVFKMNQTFEPDKCERITAEQESLTIEGESENIINEIVYASLSYYWKEIVVICLLSWVTLNFCTLVFKNYGIVLINKYFGKIKCVQEKTECINQKKDETQTILPNDAEQSSKDSSPEAEVRYNSRYLQDFEPIRLIGKGGFGLVFESKHKIDEMHYAVKRISIPAQKEKRNRFMREILALSKLNHGGIVRYFNAWIEEPPPGWQEKQDKLCDFDLTEGFTEGYSLTENVDSILSGDRPASCKYADDWLQSYKSNNSLEIIFEESGYKATDPTDISSLSQYKHSFADDESATTSRVHWDKSVMQSQSSDEDSQTKQRAPVFVYIQMQLCRKESLKDWLFGNKDRSKFDMLQIFNQIIGAVNYVHQNKLIHRDLKPSNIFFSMDGLIKIGDFGLVTNTLEDHSHADTNVNNTKKKIHKHTNEVGTQLYMSPEQVNCLPYDHKVDIFSMGIILYELLESFNTESERIFTLNNVRNKIFPDEFLEKHPKEWQVLQKILSFIPSERPEAHDLLKEDIFRNN